MKNNTLSLYKSCELCPRRCGADRPAGELGFCKAPSKIAIASWMPHRFEEPPISGMKGSGAIFFSFCTARCIYCQNYNYSRGIRAKPISIERLAEIMLKLQDRGCHNINLVTPTHYAPSVIEALIIAKKKGLSIPILYNSNGYESEDTLKMLEGYVDIYLADAKYSDDGLAREQGGFVDYSIHNAAALREMYRQVGYLKLNTGGIAGRGIIIRHLVLPGYMENTRGVLRHVAREISDRVHISLMGQYSPILQVKRHPHLGKRLSAWEYDKAVSLLHDMGFENGWVQEDICH